MGCDPSSGFTLLEPVFPASEVQSPPAMCELNALVFDDEPAITRMLSRMLTARGCRVMSATDGDEALKLHAAAASKGDPVDVVFVDYNVRDGKNGPQVFEAIHAADGRALGILCSGGDEPNHVDALRQQGFFASLPKPFEPEALMRLLDAASQRLFSSGAPDLETALLQATRHG